MPRIICPHCGKEIDYIVPCLGCKGGFKNEPEVVREFLELPIEEQNSLRAEYDSKHPELTQSEKKYKLYIILIIVFFGLVGLFFAMSLVYAYELQKAKYIFIALCISALIGMFIFCCHCSHWEKERLECYKRYQKWLKKEKRVHYAIPRKLLDEGNFFSEQK